MEIIRFGNWSVSPYGIEWMGQKDINYAFALHNLVHTGLHKKSILYQWLVDMAADLRLSSEDIYSLNTAFFYCLDLYRSELEIPNYVLLAETLKAQQEMLESRKSKRLRAS
jgi:hypothetical protein